MVPSIFKQSFVALMWLRKLCETDFVVATPDRKHKTLVCHVNMLKPYVTRSDVGDVRSVATFTSVTPPLYSPESNGLFV